MERFFLVLFVSFIAFVLICSCNPLLVGMSSNLRGGKALTNYLVDLDVANAKQTNISVLDRWHITSATYDSANNIYYTLDDVTLTSLNAKTGDFVNQISIKSNAVLELQYDSVANKLFGMMLDDSLGCGLVEINTDNGNVKLLIKTSPQWGVYLGSSTYDVQGHRYFCSMGEDTDLVVVFDTRSNVKAVVDVKDTKIPMGWVPSLNKMFAVNGDNKMELLDLKTGNGTVIGNGLVYGIPDLSTAVVDDANMKVYVTVINFLNNYLTTIDLKTGVATRQSIIGSYTMLYLSK